MSWKDIIKAYEGSNEGYNRLVNAIEIIQEMQGCLEWDEPTQLVTATILQKIKDEDVRGYSNPEVQKILASDIHQKLEILANLFRE